MRKANFADVHTVLATVFCLTGSFLATLNRSIRHRRTESYHRSRCHSSGGPAPSIAGEAAASGRRPRLDQGG